MAIRNLLPIMNRSTDNAHWHSQPYTSTAAPIIVGGCGRSGTTLMRVILDSHKNICCGPESGLFLHGAQKTLNVERLAFGFDLPAGQIGRLQKTSGSLAQFIDQFFSTYSVASGKSRWAEKTPKNVTVIPYIFEHFPSARFIHMIRDGRDTACSLRTHPRYKVVDGQLTPTNIRNPWIECVSRWVEDVRSGLKWRNDARYIEIRYEDLVMQPEHELRKLMAFLDEPWDEDMLKFYEKSGVSRDVTKFPQNPEATEPIYNSSVNKWRTEMTIEESNVFKKRAGDLLVTLGYASDNQWRPFAGQPQASEVLVSQQNDRS